MSDATEPGVGVPIDVVAVDPPRLEQVPAPSTQWLDVLGAVPFEAAIGIAAVDDGSFVLSVTGTNVPLSLTTPDAFALRRIDGDGTVRWTRTFPTGVGTEVHFARPPLAVTSDGTAVVAMAIRCGQECPDLGRGPLASGGVAVAFTVDGVALWQRAISGDPSGIDAKESTIAVGVSQDALAPPRVHVICQDGSLETEISLPRRGVSPPGRVVRSPAVAITPDGDLVVGNGRSLQRLRRSGAEVWSRNLLGVAEIELLAASSGVIAVSGIADPSPPDFIAAFGLDGSLRWANTGYANALAAHDDGSVARTASSLVELLDADGSPVWARTFPYLTPPHEGTDFRDGGDAELGVAFASDGSVLACGWAKAVTDVGLGPMRLEGGFVMSLAH